MGTIVPLDAHSDGLNRAWRTFLQGFLLDLAAALSVALPAMLGGIQFTWEYAVTLGLFVGRTFLQTLVAYIHRRVFPPLQ